MNTVSSGSGRIDHLQGRPQGASRADEHVKITEDVGKYAAEQQIFEEQSLHLGLEQKARESWRRLRGFMRGSEHCAVSRLLLAGAFFGVFFVRLAAAQNTDLTKESLEQILARAEKGDAVAQFNAGFAYQTGEGVPKDPTAAIAWYCRAAERGNMGAQFMLGFIFRTGEGVEPNYSEALKWYRKAAENGDGASASEIGAMYEHGVGVAADDQEAARWYKIAAERGEDKGAANLGRCYRDGRGVPQDDREAVRLLRIAAEAGDADAQSDLGVAAVVAASPETKSRHTNGSPSQSRKVIATRKRTETLSLSA